MLGDRISEPAQIEPREQQLSFAEEHRANREMQLVDQARLEKLPDRRRAAAHSDVAVAGRGTCLRQRLVNAFRDEPEFRPALHHQRPACVVREHEGRDVVWRLLAPPSLPALVRPRSSHRAEHVAAEDPRAESLHAARGDLVVDASLAAGLRARLGVHRPPGACVEEPLHERFTTDAEWMLEVLIGAGTEAVDGDGEVSYDETRHDLLVMQWEWMRGRYFSGNWG